MTAEQKIPEGNTGTNNTGGFNTGDRNSGYRNSGDRNSGDRNSGYRNSGDRNSGYRNSGYRNSGDRNSGYRNSGDRNSGDRNSGYLNSDKPTVRIFNKDTGIARDDFDHSIFPDFFRFDYIPTEWIESSNMTDEEKLANPLHNIAGGYLKKHIARTYNKEQSKEAMQKEWRKSWDAATDSDRRKVYNIPNWNNDVFKEISGIDVDKELNNVGLNLAGEQVEVTIKGKTYKAIIQ